MKVDSGRLVTLAFWVGLLAAIVVLWLTGVFEDAWSGLREARPAPLGLVVLVGMALPVVHAWRWRVVMRSLGTHLTAGQAADITVSSALLNYASPGFVGASAKALLANQSRGVAYRQSALAIAFEHTLDLGLMAVSSLIVILIIGPARFREAAEPLEAFASLVGILLTLGIIGIALLVAWRLGAFRRIDRMFSAAAGLGREVDVRAVALLTALYWLLQVLVVGLLFWSLKVPIVAIDILAISTVPVLAGMLAPVPGGVGVREAVIVALTTVTGVSAGTLVTLAIIQRVLLVSALPLSLGVLRLARRIDVRLA